MAIWQTFYSNKNEFNKPGADLGILRGGGGVGSRSAGMFIY